VNLEQLAEDFAPYECKAIQIREERFRLSNEIHRLQENPAEYEIKKDSLDHLVEQIKAETVEWGDTIKWYLDSIFKYHLQDKTQRNAFLDKVRVINEEMGCEK
jgi:hypothetical protein